MANRRKNEKFPYGPDPRMLRKPDVTDPETPKHWVNSPARYCKKLKGDHSYDLDEKERDGGISHYSIVKGGTRRHYYFGWSDNEPLEPGEYVERVNVWLHYRCTACGKKEYLTYEMIL